MSRPLPKREVQDKKRRAYCYARVSSHEQGEIGHSLAAQKATLKKYCATEDIEIVELHTEVASGGDHPMKRNNFKHILEELQRGKADLIIVVKLDRLSRCSKDINKLVEDFEKWGVTLHSITEKIDLSNAMGRFLFGLIRDLAQMEKDLISERTIASLAKKKEEGQLTGRCPWSKQVSVVNGIKMLIDSPEDIETMKMVYDLRNTMHKLAKGTTAPLQWAKVVERVVAAGRKNKNGEAVWCQTQVRSIYKQYKAMLAERALEEQKEQEPENE